MQNELHLILTPVVFALAVFHRINVICNRLLSGNFVSCLATDNFYFYIIAVIIIVPML